MSYRGRGDASWDSSASGFTMSQAKEPAAHKAAATRNDAVQLKWCAIQGVREAVTAPPICPPIFITPDTDPAEAPAMSAVTDQNELCDRYSAPVPHASTTA